MSETNRYITNPLHVASLYLALSHRLHVAHDARVQGSESKFSPNSPVAWCGKNLTGEIHVGILRVHH